MKLSHIPGWDHTLEKPDDEDEEDDTDDSGGSAKKKSHWALTLTRMDNGGRDEVKPPPDPWADFTSSLSGRKSGKKRSSQGEVPQEQERHQKNAWHAVAASKEQGLTARYVAQPTVGYSVGDGQVVPVGQSPFQCQIGNNQLNQWRSRRVVVR